MTRYAMLIVLTFVLPAMAENAGNDAKLPRDPNNVYGQFDNGLKYIIRKNANPPGKVALYLHVKTGALNETDQQNGLAHFLEHMAFNGSTHYGPGKLIPLLNHLGMTFGADTNAHTNLWETVYKLTMPDTQDKTIDTALTIFSDYASGLGLAKVQIESERRIILEEARSRKSVEQRMQRKLFKELFADARLATHDIIGDEEQIKTFPQNQFLDYWNTWYRPENMTLIAVGDIDPQAIVARAKEKLGSFAARAPSREPLKAGLRPFVAPRALVNTDPEEVTGSVMLLALQPARLPITTKSQLRRIVLEGVSEWIVNRRFSDMVRLGSAPFRDASVNTDDFIHEAYEVSASASGQREDWNKMLDATIAEVSRAIDHGFTAHELELARSEMISGAEQDVRSESTRDSTLIVRKLSNEVGTDSPILSASQRLELMKEIFAQMTVDNVHKAFVENFKTRNYAYVLSMPSEKDGVKLPGENDILAAANAAWAKKTEPPTEVKLAGSILASEPDAGKIVAQETDKDLGITNVTFANGVLMHHKFSDYKKDQAAVSIIMPAGSIEETAANRGVSAVASIMLSRPATSRFTSSQIRDVLTGKNVSVGGDISFDTLDLGVVGSPRDLGAGMQLAYAILTDAVLEQSALDDWKKLEIQNLEARKTSAPSQLTDAMSATFFGGDIRLTPLTREMIDRQERSAAEAWFKRIVGHAAIEVTVVGDIQLKDALDLIAKYVGSLPKRTDDFSALNSLRKLDRGPGPYAKSIHFKAIAPKAIVYAGFVSCDALDPERRPLTLASQIITVRMIERIRKQEQLVYSIFCSNTPGRAISGTGTFSASAPTDPQNADKLAQTILDMLRDFADKGPSEDELATAKKQIANRLDSQMKEPSFWMVQIQDMAYRGRPMDDLKQLPGVYQTYTVEQVRDATRKYVKDDRSIRMEVIPDVAATATPATGAASRVE